MSGRNSIPTFSARLTELRKGRCLSQQQLAEAASMSLFSVSKLERGERFPSLELAGRIADALGFTVDALRQPPGTVPMPRPGGPVAAPRHTEEKGEAEPIQATKKPRGRPRKTG
jgi:transcriptional regulator with XRE-family HTH domain